MNPHLNPTTDELPEFALATDKSRLEFCRCSSVNWNTVGISPLVLLVALEACANVDVETHQHFHHSARGEIEYYLVLSLDHRNWCQILPAVLLCPFAALGMIDL